MYALKSNYGVQWKEDLVSESFVSLKEMATAKRHRVQAVWMTSASRVDCPHLFRESYFHEVGSWHLIECKTEKPLGRPGVYSASKHCVFPKLLFTIIIHLYYCMKGGQIFSQLPALNKNPGVILYSSKIDVVVVVFHLVKAQSTSDEYCFRFRR